MNAPLGWKWLANATKWHFFGADGRALCGRWMTLSREPGEQDGHDSPDNCKACARKVKR